MVYSGVRRRIDFFSVATVPQAHRACGPLAQLAEQQTLNLRVEGSIPSRLTTNTQEISPASEFGEASDTLSDTPSVSDDPKPFALK
jgi:hypothetical protein